MKRVRTWCLAALLASVDVTSRAYDFQVDGICYNVVSMNDHTCEVTYGDNVYAYKGEVTIPANVTYCEHTFRVVGIGCHAFRNCEEVTGVTLPAGIKCVEFQAFYGCSEMRRITIPGSVTEIGDYAFAGCPLETIVALGAKPASIFSDSFGGVSRLDCVVKVPRQAVDEYRQARYWCKFWKVQPITAE